MSRYPDESSHPDDPEALADDAVADDALEQGNTLAADALAEFLRAITPPEAPKAPLEMGGVADRNVPGQERVWFQANAHVRLNEYLLAVGIALPGDQILPINDYLFWFGDHAVDPGTWVVVYTGPGQTRVTSDQHTGKPVLVLHWGRAGTVFTIDALVPMLVRPVREHTQIGTAGK